MYAGSTILRAMPESVEDGIAVVRERAVPGLQDVPGFAGCSMLVDRAAAVAS